MRIIKNIRKFLRLSPDQSVNPEVRKHFKRNFITNTLDGAFWLMGDSFISVETILPVFASTLTDSAVLIGLVPALFQAGWFIPQFFMAGQVKKLKQKLPFAKKFGLKKNQVVVMIHCGSRGLGHQVASDYIKEMEKEYGIKNLPDRELINAPIKSKLGKDYMKAMNCAVNFAFANRQVITHWVRESFKNIFPKSEIKILYDVCHNIAKIEEHLVEDTLKGTRKKRVCVHRKGATRSFHNQPVLIPGTMGTSSYVLVGTKEAEKKTFGSTAHGAGRAKSRMKANKEYKGEKVKKEMNKKGIEIKAGSWKSYSEESPGSYKDVDEVVKIVHEEGLSKKVARLEPVIVIMG